MLWRTRVLLAISLSFFFIASFTAQKPSEVAEFENWLQAAGQGDATAQARVAEEYLWHPQSPGSAE